jgi:SAM-dependent methyltransferase
MTPEEMTEQGFEIRAADAMTGTEATDAKAYWADYGVRSWYQKQTAWGRLIAELVHDLDIKSALEFGCNAGRNLSAIAERNPECAVVGIDLNAEAIAAGREALALDLRVGDETALEAFGPRAFDLVFTISVIDHVVDAEGICRAMLEAAGRYAFFLEVCLPVDGKVLRHYDHFHGKVRDSTGASYSWDLRPFLRAHPRVRRLDTRAGDLHSRSVGPY